MFGFPLYCATVQYIPYSLKSIICTLGLVIDFLKVFHFPLQGK